MDLNLQGKIAVVTGASKGIGLAITKALVAEGGHVIAGARDVANDACGPDADVETGWWQYRDRQLGQFFSSRSWHLDYCAAKAALTNFSKALSKELGPKGFE